MLSWKFMSLSLRSQMQYPASFMMLTVSHFIGTFVDILGVWILFDRFHMIKGWTLPEVGLIYGIVHISFSFAELFSRGFDTFSQMVKSGDFDRLLLRPISPLFQVAVSEVRAMRIGRLLQSLIILFWSGYKLSFFLFSIHTFIIIFSILGTTALFYGIFILQATVSFWTIETLELMNIATYGSVFTGQYPMNIYNKSFRLIFTLIIPVACVVYYPIATLLHHETIPFWFAMFLPLVGGAFLYLACKIWRFGVQRYRSTGS